MTDINNFISEIVKEKDILDVPVFLNFLRDELKRKGIKLTINRTNDLHLVPLNTPNIIGVELDLSDHDKKKDDEIEKYKKELEKEKNKHDLQIMECQKKIEELEEHYKFSMMQIDDILVEFLGVTHEIMDSPSGFEDVLREFIDKNKENPESLPTEPIKMADWIVHHFKQGKEYAIYERDMNGKLYYVEIDGEKVPVQTGEYGKSEEVREIADYLLVYCKHHSEEEQ